MAKIEVECITTRASEKFDRLLMSHPDMRKLMQKLIAQGLKKARAKVVKDMRGFVGKDMRYSAGDPRNAATAVKHSVWKNELGGSISILNKRRASNTRVDMKRPRKLDMNPHQRGGNRIKRQGNTDADRLEKYWGSDRSFVIRFLNTGTDDRNSRYGNRGFIAGRRFFGPSAKQRIEEMAAEIERQISEVIEQIGN